MSVVLETPFGCTSSLIFSLCALSVSATEGRLSIATGAAPLLTREDVEEELEEVRRLPETDRPGLRGPVPAPTLGDRLLTFDDPEADPPPLLLRLMGGAEVALPVCWLFCRRRFRRTRSRDSVKRLQNRATWDA